MNKRLLSQPSSDLIHISKLVEQLNLDYQAMRSQRHQLAQWEEDQDFSILGEIELFATKIQGYASQVMTQNFQESIDEMAQQLKQLKLFEIEYFADWYFTQSAKYSQIKAYIEAQNYLRLLLLEYLNQHSSLQSAV
ncbi:hypothetical protein LEP3755_24220 [Leptolyngbya sp. NIES-3755]|nr:hypothetical protein LEP3755_24220 [Leptolyngbya sp. NIES-3755]